MEESRANALFQMRKSVEKLGFSTEAYGDATMMRFLIARSMEPAKGAKMFVQWRKWREAMVPEGSVCESEVAEELEARKIFLQGSSKKGLAVVIVKASRHFPSKDQLQFKKFVVHLLDKVIASGCKGREIGNEKWIAIVDLHQISYKNVDPRGLITGFQFLQNYYPERLGKCFILNMPWFFVSIWRMVSRFVDSATLKNILIVSNEEERRIMIEEVGEVLPVEYGGKAKLIALQDAIIIPHLDA
ncbi:sec14 cytosolic factor-like [Momordica charantia]|uniref:Sec14 cytosolic factor-like n=1 Tax=Momordica charantia TaxID=3673 RepID=A0A6J1CY34_MOMCH|nr:sec14 cytosolic factor-like [Momordica charantia]